MGERGRRGGGIDEGAGTIDDKLDPFPRRCDISAREAGGLLSVPIWKVTRCSRFPLGQTHAVLAENAETMGLI